MDIKSVDVENIVNHLIQRGYNKDQIIQILEYATTLTKIKFNICENVGFIECKNSDINNIEINNNENERNELSNE